MEQWSSSSRSVSRREANQKQKENLHKEKKKKGNQDAPRGLLKQRGQVELRQEEAH